MRLIDADTIEPFLKEERDFHKKMYDNMQQPCEHDDKQIVGAYYTAYRKSYHAVKDAPTIDAVPVVHGYNTEDDSPSLFECSVCGWSCWDTYCGDTDTYNYCPNCGAMMKGEENER